MQNISVTKTISSAKWRPPCPGGDGLISHYLPHGWTIKVNQEPFIGVEVKGIHVLKVKIDNTLQWRHNEGDGVSNHQPHDCLLKRLIRRRSKKTSKLRVTGLFAGNSPVTGVFPAQMASNAENVSIWWRHHEWNCRRNLFSGGQIIWKWIDIATLSRTLSLTHYFRQGHLICLPYTWKVH